MTNEWQQTEGHPGPIRGLTIPDDKTLSEARECVQRLIGDAHERGNPRLRDCLGDNRKAVTQIIAEALAAHRHN